MEERPVPRGLMPIAVAPSGRSHSRAFAVAPDDDRQCVGSAAAAPALREKHEHAPRPREADARRVDCRQADSQTLYASTSEKALTMRGAWVSRLTRTRYVWPARSGVPRSTQM